MKTNITLTSQSRELFGVTIRQETKTGHLNLSDLQRAYDAARRINGWSEKRVDHILPQVENRERVFYILKETQLINVDFLTFMENCENQGFYKYLKSLGVYKTTGRGATKSTGCNPYVWGLVAMEMHPQIYAKVVVWFTDKLILNRIEAGDMFKDLSKAVSKFHDVDYARLSRALNHIIFGRHESGIRNTGTVQQLKELERLEANLAFAVDGGLFKSFEAVIDHLRAVWEKKYHPQSLVG